MTRNLKALGLAMVAAFAMSAVIASAAQATTNPLKLTAEQFPVALTGTQVAHPGQVGHKFTTSAGTSITCANAQFDATVSAAEGAAGEITVAPTYSNCRANPGEFKVTVTMTHCDYRFTGGNLEAGTTHTFQGITTELICPPGVAGPDVEIWFNDPDHAEAKLPNCTLTPQKFEGVANRKGENTAHNVTGSPDDILLTTTVAGINVVRTGSILCGAANQTAVYTGSTTIEGFIDAGQTSPYPTIKFNEGAKQGITLSDPTP